MKFHGFVIDTTAYAGNFERETVAYMTGQYGDCGVGAARAGQAREELSQTTAGEGARLWMALHIAKRPDEHECCRPAGIVPTPGWFNDGMGNAHPVGTPQDIVLAKYLESVARIPSLTKPSGPGVYPSYQSVVAWFDEEPPAWVLEALKSRAFVYLSNADKWRQPVEITGFRLITD